MSDPGEFIRKQSDVPHVDPALARWAAQAVSEYVSAHPDDPQVVAFNSALDELRKALS